MFVPFPRQQVVAGPETKRRLHVRLDPALHSFLREQAAARHTTVSAIVVEAILALRGKVERKASGAVRQW